MAKPAGRSVSGREQVDWEYINEELRDIPADFREQRFHALKHVVDIFSSGDPQGKTAQIRDHEARIGDLVDMVVEGYYTGFAHSIQSYSQILQQFQDARQQVDAMRTALGDAQRQVSAQSRHLGSQWQRGLALAASQALLREVQATAALPAAVDKAVAAKDWPQAVALLLEVSQRLAQPELQAVGALRKMRGEMAGLCRGMQGELCGELLASVYNQPARPGGLQAASPSMVLPSAAHPSPPASPLVAATDPALLARAAAARARLGHKAALVPEGGAAGQAGGGAGCGVRGLVHCLARLDAVRDARAALALQARLQVARAVRCALQQVASAAAQPQQQHGQPPQAAPGGGAGGGLWGAASPALSSQHVQGRAAGLVGAVADACLEVLIRLGEVLVELVAAPGPAPRAVLKHLRPAPHDTSAETAASRGQQGPLSPGGSPRKGRRGRGAASQRQHEREELVRSELMRAWLAMQEELHSLLGCLLAGRLRPLGERGPASTRARGGLVGAAAGLLAHPLGWIAKFDAVAERVSIRVEAALGGEQPPTSTSAGVRTPPPSAGAAGSSAQPATPQGPGRPAAAPPRLQFSLPGLGPGPAGEEGQGQAGLLMPGGWDSTRLVLEALGQQDGSVYLLPCLHAPVARLCSCALTLINFFVSHAAAASGGPGTSRPPPPNDLRQQAARSVASLTLLGDGSQGEVGNAAAARSGGRHLQPCLWLLEAADDYVVDVFLPQVWKDLRARCLAALEQQDAFTQPSLAVVSSYATSDRAGVSSTVAPGESSAPADAGQRLLPVVSRFADGMLSEVRAWSAAMPAFKASFLGVAENVLGRLLDACWGQALVLAGGSRAWRLAARQDVAHVQASEPDAGLLGDAVCFCVPPPSPSGAIGGPGDIDVAAFTTALRLQDRPVLVPSFNRWVGSAAPAAASQQPGGAANSPPLIDPPTDGLPHGPWAGGGRGGRGRGLAAGGVAALVELALLVSRECGGVSPDELLLPLSAPSASASRLSALASLATTCDHLALAAAAAAAAPPLLPQGQGPEAGVRAGRGELQRLLDGLPPTMWQIVQRLRALSAQLLRTLRLELQLLVASSLQGLLGLSHMVEGEEAAKEVYPLLPGLSRNLTRLAELLTAQLAAPHAAYVLGGLPAATAHMAVWLLPDIREINTAGIERMVRSLTALQHTLSSLVPSTSTTGQGGSDREAARMAARTAAFDRARAYFQLLNLPAEEVVRLASEQPMRFAYFEWMALLQVQVPGRAVQDSTVAAMQSLLDRAHGLTTGQRIVGAMGTVVTTIITNPVEKVADVAFDVIKLGAGGLVAGAMIPARQIGRVFRKLEEVANNRGGA